MSSARSPMRFPLMALGLVALLTGLWSGLLRVGLILPLLRPTFPLAHGPLMVAGFLGTLIGLERAVALGNGWAWLAPICCGLGTLTILVGAPHDLPALLMTAGGLVLLAASLNVWIRQPVFFTQILALGALALVIANGLWLQMASMAATVSWWMAFLVLTIAAERLELTRVLPRSRLGTGLFMAVLVVFAAGLLAGGLGSRVGVVLLGVSLLAMAAWLVRYDIARRTVRMRGLTRYTAACLLSGYVWLAVSGSLMLWYGPVFAGPYYDAILHSVFLGFVFTMIFGHAPIIFPAVLGLAVPYRGSYYVHLGLLHVSLLLRVGGDLWGGWTMRQWGTGLNAVAVLLFFANTVTAVIGGLRAAQSAPRRSVA